MISMYRPSRGEVDSATTTRYWGFLRAPVRRNLILSTRILFGDLLADGLLGAMEGQLDGDEEPYPHSEGFVNPRREFLRRRIAIILDATRLRIAQPVPRCRLGSSRRDRWATMKTPPSATRRPAAVDLRGLEPLASRMRTARSPS